MHLPRPRAPGCVVAYPLTLYAVSERTVVAGAEAAYLDALHRATEFFERKRFTGPVRYAWEPHGAHADGQPLRP